MSRERIAALVQEHGRFLVTCHVMPDADAVGSMMGLAALLQHLGKSVTLYSRDPIPEALSFLAGTEQIVHDVRADERFDATFVVDTAAKTLLPSDFPAPSVTGTLVVIDHHLAHEPFGDVDLRDVGAVATGEVVLSLARDLGIGVLPKAAAEPLYTAIVADTGGFRYPGTSAGTLRLAADLLEAGVDPWRVAYHVFESWPKERLSLLSLALSTLETSFDGRFALMTVSRDLVIQANATDEMVEGLVNYGRMLRGVEIAALLWERAPKATLSGPALRTKISLRATHEIDVSKIAVELGGGGHRAAAGATLPVDLLVARERLFSIVERALETRSH